jgi:hypothetical protein
MMLAKGSLASHNFLKIIVQETLLKAFSTSTYIMAHSRCKSRKVWMLKGMASQSPKVNTSN